MHPKKKQKGYEYEKNDFINVAHGLLYIRYSSTSNARPRFTLHQRTFDCWYRGSAFPALKNGKWTVIDFWATWCPDCRKEIPTVKGLYEKYGKEVKFIGVSFDTQKANLDKYVEANGIKWEQYSEFKKWKETNISKAYNIQWLPSMYLIDPQGKVAYVTVLAERMGQKLADIFGEK